jgi:putative membrane protein
VSASAAPAIGTGLRLADGQWHRLHPATPLLRGGIALVAILGVILANLRDVLFQLVTGAPDFGEDPFAWVFTNGYTAAALGVIAGGLLLFIGGFTLSWRMHTFRITDELVEVRSGILFRTHRRGRLDRIQGINISRSLLARLFGAAKVDVNVAGQNANVQLAYLGSASADELRREILLLASGTHSTAADVPVEAPVGATKGLVERRVSELLAPERDPALAPPESVVQIHLGRLMGSLILSGFTVWLLAVVAAIVLVSTTTRQYVILLGFVPTIIGLGSVYVRRFTRSLQYSIAATPDGVRIGFGLLSTSNETLPPGRIHAIEVHQPLFWRAAGWWIIRINRAASSPGRGSAHEAQTTVLPVGNLSDVRKVLELVLPGLPAASVDQLERGMISRGRDDFVTSPRRAAVLRWFSWRRNGFAITPDAVLLRRGGIWRTLIIVPQARMQSVSLYQGPLLRRLRLASLRLHTVAGPVDPRIGAVDATQATQFFRDVTDAAVRSATVDTSHRWRRSTSAPAARPATALAP